MSNKIFKIRNKFNYYWCYNGISKIIFLNYEKSTTSEYNYYKTKYEQYLNKITNRKYSNNRINLNNRKLPNFKNSKIRLILNINNNVKKALN